jgi:hypothetical protein
VAVTANPPALAFALLQLATVGLFVVAVRRGNTAAAINAIGGIAIALVSVAAVPDVVARSDWLAWALPIWVATAVFLHELGMLGWYESTWWWDHLTHTVSAALVAALVYATVPVALPELIAVEPSPGVTVTVTLAFTFAIGVFWELLELVARDVGDRFDVDPVLVIYGWRDTAFDLAFDVVGAVLVVGVDLRVFRPLVARAPAVATMVALGSAAVVVSGSVSVAIYVGFVRSNGV